MNVVIRVRRTGLMLPALETVLSQFGKRPAGAPAPEGRYTSTTDVEVGGIRHEPARHSPAGSGAGT